MMNFHLSRHSYFSQLTPAILRVVRIGLFPLLLTQGLRAAATDSQTFTLQPGWNAIHLSVQPTNDQPAAVFSGLPVDMVWAYFPTRTPLEFIQDPGDGLWNVPGWSVWLPPGKPDAEALTNLFAIQAHQSYLVKITGSAPVTLTVTGPAGYREIKWQPDGFTLTGLPLDPLVNVRSGDYFFNSPAHKGQSRFRLDPNGTWIQVGDNTILRSGTAYWIFSKGAPDFSAPFDLEYGGASVLDYGALLDTRDVTVRNRGAGSQVVKVENPGNLPLVVSTLDPATGRSEWLPLSSRDLTIPAGETVTLTLGIRRAGMPATIANLLKFSSQGIVRKLPVSAANPIAGSPNPNAGLWVGTVTLDAVSEPHGSNPTATTATPAEFTMRVLLHVNSAGGTRLLKEVILMKQPNSADNPPVPGALVLLSNPALIPGFTAPSRRDGSPFANRISSIGFDFAGHDQALTGAFGGSALTGTITIPRDLPTHPFRHRYHPDHDGLTPNYQPQPPGLPADQQEVWDVTRNLKFTFAPIPTTDLSPAAGYSERSGTYEESVTGLHKNTLVTTGTFTLNRLNNIGQLNPSPVTP